MKYESPITCQSKDMANVKVFEKWVKLKDQGHNVKLLVPTLIKYQNPST